jgi:hypothetical protein
MKAGFSPQVLRTSGLSPLELSSGMARGFDAPSGTGSRWTDGLTARQALEAVVLRGLRQPPCVISFSGGRDSSTVLAIAVALARREGLPLPVPVSLRFPQAAESQESDWQEEVVQYLGLSDWERLEFVDELDLVGPYAQRVLLGVGLVWPFNSHFHLPVSDLARGGSMMTGFGGDELMATGWLWGREMTVLAGQARPEAKDVVRIAAALSPRPVRRAFIRRRMHHDGPPARPWLTAVADEAVTAAMIEDMLKESLHFGRSVRAWIDARYRTLVFSALGKIAAMNHAAAEHPLADPTFLRAFALERGRRGFVDRTEAVRYLVGDLLPDTLISRSSKALFGDAFWSVHSRHFAREWNGGGLDPTLVNLDVLNQMWRGPASPDGRTKAMFQAAWLAQHEGPGSPEPVDE